MSNEKNSTVISEYSSFRDIYTGENYGKYHLSPNQSVKLSISKNTDGLDNYTELILVNKGHLLEITGLVDLAELDKDIFYDIEKQQITKIEKVNGEFEVVDTLQTSLDGITLTPNSVLMDFNGSREFNIDTSKNYTIEIYNRSKEPIDIEAYVIYR